jgi:hypothetical protein
MVMNRLSVVPRGSILQIKSGSTFYKVTEHNRSDLQISTERIEKSQRMANGTLRKFWIADKKTFSVTWDMLPYTTALTVDGGWGAKDLRDFYYSDLGRQPFDIRINLATNGTNQELAGYQEATVVFSEANFAVVKRGLEPFWNVSITLEEV